MATGAPELYSDALCLLVDLLDPVGLFAKRRKRSRRQFMLLSQLGVAGPALEEIRCARFVRIRRSVPTYKFRSISKVWLCPVPLGVKNDQCPLSPEHFSFNQEKTKVLCPVP